MTFMFFLSSPGEYAGFPDSTCVSCSGCFSSSGSTKAKCNFCSVGWISLLPKRTLKKAICIETTEKMVFLSGESSQYSLKSVFCRAVIVKAVPPLSLSRNFFRVALPVTLRSLNHVAKGLPGSWRCNGKILLGDLYPILCPEKSWHLLLKGGRVKRDKLTMYWLTASERDRECKSVCDQVGQSWCLLLITLNSDSDLCRVTLVSSKCL